MLDLDKRKELHCPKCGKPLVIYQTAEAVSYTHLTAQGDRLRPRHFMISPLSSIGMQMLSTHGLPYCPLRVSRRNLRLRLRMR